MGTPLVLTQQIDATTWQALGLLLTLAGLLVSVAVWRRAGAGRGPPLTIGPVGRAVSWTAAVDSWFCTSAIVPPALSRGGETREEVARRTPLE